MKVILLFAIFANAAFSAPPDETTTFNIKKGVGRYENNWYISQPGQSSVIYTVPPSNPRITVNGDEDRFLAWKKWSDSHAILHFRGKRIYQQQAVWWFPLASESKRTNRFSAYGKIVFHPSGGARIAIEPETEILCIWDRGVGRDGDSLYICKDDEGVTLATFENGRKVTFNWRIKPYDNPYLQDVIITAYLYSSVLGRAY